MSNTSKHCRVVMIADTPFLKVGVVMIPVANIVDVATSTNNGGAVIRGINAVYEIQPDVAEDFRSFIDNIMTYEQWVVWNGGKGGDNDDDDDDDDDMIPTFPVPAGGFSNN